MRINWSLILNILLLIGVVIAIVRTLKAKRAHHQLPIASQAPAMGLTEKNHCDEIIAVRKVNADVSEQFETVAPTSPSINRVAESVPSKVQVSSTTEKQSPAASSTHAIDTSKSAVIFLLAKEKRQLAGYELLQTVLAAGLRFGEGQLFHRYQSVNGQGTVLCSLAAATPTGVFDMQNIGAFTVRGLCLFMHASGNTTIDAERFEIMLDTAKQLSEGLDTYLLDDQRRPLSHASIERYHRLLNLETAVV